MNGLTVSAKSLMPTPFAKVTFPVLIVGGALVGAFGGQYFFGDAALRRLRDSHEADKAMNTDAQKYVPKYLL